MKGFHFLVFIFLVVVPIGLHLLITLKFQKEHRLRTYFLTTGVVALLLITVGHFYYNVVYNLAIFPSKEYMSFFIRILFFGLVIVFLLTFLFRRSKKESGLSFRGYAILLIVLIIFFIWLIPLGYKYDYVDRNRKAEELFLMKDSHRVTQDGEIMIALVESDYDPIMRPRYRYSSTYNTYFYIRNNGEMPYRGNIFLTLYNEDGHSFDMKLLEDVEVDPHSTELLMEQKNPVMPDSWVQRSFGTEQKVASFKAIITH